MSIGGLLPFPGRKISSLSYPPVVCQRRAMLHLGRMLRKSRQRLNILNIRDAS